MKAMVIGLGPEYNYPGSIEVWGNENTRYASNHGASLISRAIIRQFNADYIDDFSDIESLNHEYDTCFIAFATHITTWRDVSEYADVIERLTMKVIALSLGVQDYMENSERAFIIHPSMKRLLNIVSSKSEFIGVRGFYTASLLYKNDFQNVIPVGCPTMYWGLTDALKINKGKTYSNPAIVYHRTLAEVGEHFLKEEIPLIGQDFLDEAVFTSNLEEDKELKESELSHYNEYGNFEVIKMIIKRNGIFHKSSVEWFDHLRNYDFILGSRLHGCIGALIQGIPAVMLARDLRVNEIADFFGIPKLKYEELKDHTVKSVFEMADYSKFESIYKLRYNNYLSFLKMNGIDTSSFTITDRSSEYSLNAKDVFENIAIIQKDLQALQLKMEDEQKELHFAKSLRPIIMKMHKIKKLFTFGG